MNKFLQKVIMFFLPVIACLCLFEVFLQSIPNDYKYKMEQLTKNVENIEILVLGSSHAHYGINPEYFNLNGFNFSNISQSLDIDYNLLEMYGEKINQLKMVIIPISYFSMFSRLESGGDSWRVKNNVLYYHYHTSFSIKNYFELLNGTMRSHIYRAYEYIVNKEKVITVSNKGFGLGYSSTIKNNMEETGKAAALRHSLYDSMIFDSSKIIIQKIIDWCDARGIKLLFVTLPAYYTYRNRLDYNQLDETINYMINISDKNVNVYYHNFLDDRDFIEDDFFDADHFNEIGARKITEKINEIIMEIIN
jgi:hypothetical protein